MQREISPDASSVITLRSHCTSVKQLTVEILRLERTVASPAGHITYLLKKLRYKNTLGRSHNANSKHKTNAHKSQTLLSESPEDPPDHRRPLPDPPKRPRKPRLELTLLDLLEGQPTTLTRLVVNTVVFACLVSGPVRSPPRAIRSETHETNIPVYPCAPHSACSLAPPRGQLPAGTYPVQDQGDGDPGVGGAGRRDARSSCSPSGHESGDVMGKADTPPNDGHSGTIIPGPSLNPGNVFP